MSSLSFGQYICVNKGAVKKKLHQQPQKKKVSFFVAVGANFFFTAPFVNQRMWRL